MSQQNTKTPTPICRGPWKDCPTQPDAIIAPEADGSRVLYGGETEDATYGGAFVCESVRPECRNLIKAAPDLLAVCKARTDVRHYYEFEFLPTIVAQAIVEKFPAHFGGLTLPITPEAAMERLDRAEGAAISKAEGGAA